MSHDDIILRVDATWHLTVQVGDRIRRGEKIHEGPPTGEPATAPATGIIKSIHFDAGRHEFVIAIAPAT